LTVFTLHTLRPLCDFLWLSAVFIHFLVHLALAPFKRGEKKKSPCNKLDLQKDLQKQTQLAQLSLLSTRRHQLPCAREMYRCDSIGRPVVLDGLARGATESARQHTEEPQSHTLQHREGGSITYERLEILLQRLDESARHSDDAVHFLKRRAEIEEVYAKSLRRLYEESGEAKLVSFRAIKNKLGADV